MPIVSHPGALGLPCAQRMAEDGVTSVPHEVCSPTEENAPAFPFWVHVTSGFLAFLCHEPHFLFYIPRFHHHEKMELREWVGAGVLGCMSTRQQHFQN